MSPVEPPPPPPPLLLLLLSPLLPLLLPLLLPPELESLMAKFPKEDSERRASAVKTMGFIAKGGGQRGVGEGGVWEIWVGSKMFLLLFGSPLSHTFAFAFVPHL